MVKKKFRCLNCRARFEIDVFEPGEAERKKVPHGPVHCPYCNRTDLEKDS